MNPHKTPIQVLTQRADRLQKELQDIEWKIVNLEQERDEDLILFHAAIEEAEKNAQEAKEARQKAIDAASEVKEIGEEMLAQGKWLLREAQKQLQEAEALDTKSALILRAESRLRDRKKYWAQELSKVQTGKVRRKRSILTRELEKIQKRIENKKNKPEPVTGTVPVVPQNIGTPKKDQEAQCP